MSNNYTPAGWIVEWGGGKEYRFLKTKKLAILEAETRALCGYKDVEIKELFYHG